MSKNTYLTDIGTAILLARRQDGLTQGELAHAAGITRATLSSVERGTNTSPGLATLLAISDALEVPLWALLKQATWRMAKIEGGTRNE
jgi:transcriptional regulator with XRE-family HTH domain